MNPDGKIPKDPRKNVRVLIFLILLIPTILMLFDNWFRRYILKFYAIPIGDLYLPIYFSISGFLCLKHKWLSKSSNVSRRVEIIAGVASIICALLLVAALLVK